MSNAINNLVNSTYIKRVFLKKCIKNNNKLILYFFDDNYSSLNSSIVVIKNIKNRDEFICPFSKDLPNALTIDLSSLCSYFTDYEGAITIKVKENSSEIILVPILLEKNILTLEDSIANLPFKWFIRVLDNGELRLSSIVNKKH